MSCGYEINEIEKLMQQTLNRKTVPRKLLFDVVRLFASSVKYQCHLPGCYLPGQRPPTLCKEHIKENELITLFNNEIDKELKKIESFKKIKKTDGRTRFGKMVKYQIEK